MKIEGQLNISNGLNTTGTTIIKGFRDDSAGDSFKVQDSGGTTTFVIEDGGNIGVGTGAPGASVHIIGSDTVSGTKNFFIENSTGFDLFTIENDGGFSLGYNTTPNTKASVIIGDSAVAHFQQATIIGDGATDGGGSFVGGIVTAIGAGSQATVNGSIALGGNAQAKGGIAIGNGAHSTGGTSIGQSTISNENGVAIGTNARVDGSTGGVSIGLSSIATGTQATAIGRQATATGAIGAFAAGNLAEAAGGSSVAIGFVSQATGSTAISIGSRAKGAGVRGIAIGKDTIAESIDSTVIGYQSSITAGTESIAIGIGVQSNAAGAITMGRTISPTLAKMVNSVGNSVGFGWEEASPSVLFAKTADSYISGTGNLLIGSAFKTGSDAKVHIQGEGSGIGKALLVEDFGGVDKFYVQDNGNISMGSAAAPEERLVLGEGDWIQLFSNGSSTNYGGIKFSVTGFPEYGGRIFHDDSSGVDRFHMVGVFNNAISGGLAIERGNNGAVAFFKGTTSFTPTAQVHIKGAGTGTTYGLKVQDSSGTDNLTVRNDGRVNIGQLPTSPAGLATGDLWNDVGTLKIV